MQGLLKARLSVQAQKVTESQTDKKRLRSLLMHDNSFSGDRVRMTECHDWTWSSSLWKKNSQEITRTVFIMTAVYIACAYWATIFDGYTGVDNMYLITATLTTVGLGDLSPSKPITRIVAVIVLPFGLIIFAFVMALTAAQATSHLTKEDDDENEERGNNIKLHKANEIKVLGYIIDMDSIPITITIWTIKYVSVIVLGAVFFREYEPEDRAQEREAGVHMTWVDATYFATVVATTVGYGHEIWAQSFGGKLFLCFYFLISTFVIGGIIGDLSNLYIQMKEDVITDEIINDVTYVHNVDLHCNGKVNEAEFVMYKLLQLQQYDRDLVLKLSTQFAEYDSGDNGRVVLGLDIPNADQVAEMSKGIESVEDSIELIDMWEEKKKQILLNKANLLENGIISAPPPTSEKTLDESANKAPEQEMKRRISQELVQEAHHGEDFVKLNELDFSWSKQLWKKAAMDTGRIALIMLFFYLGLSYYIFIYNSETIKNQAQGWYFIAATLSTVGFGDFAPETQIQRFLSIFMIPFGLVILGFIISFARAYTKSKPNKAQRVEDGSIRRIFETLNIPNNGYITKEQFIENSKLVSMSHKKAEEFFDKLDYNKDGKMYMPKHFEFFHTILGQFILIILNIYGTIMIGGIVFKYWPKEQTVTWIDAFYFAAVTATSIGYGDIIPTTDSFRIFMTFYMLISTVIVGINLNELLELYLHDYMANKIFSIILRSTTFVHKADIDRTGVITEAEYVMFKLQQMQKVDKNIVNRLVDHFEEMDFDDTRMLVIGLHIPSKEQANEMKKLIEESGSGSGSGFNKKMSLIDAWKEKRKQIMHDLGFDENNLFIGTNSMPRPDGGSSRRQSKTPNRNHRGTDPSATETELIEISKVLKQDNENLQNISSQVVLEENEEENDDDDDDKKKLKNKNLNSSSSSQVLEQPPEDYVENSDDFFLPIPKLSLDLDFSNSFKEGFGSKLW